MADLAIEVRDLRKTYRTPFRRKKVEALRGVTFDVERGHIFGFVGPNGAGKTTTIRTLMGLIRPSGGSAKLLGQAIPSRAARAKIGFLPEAPYFYDYLSVAELLDLAGRLFGVPGNVRKKRADDLIERVGLGRARGQSLKKFSKGMLQRAGLAQALMNDPERSCWTSRDGLIRSAAGVREIILELRDQGIRCSSRTTSLRRRGDHRPGRDVARGALHAHGTPAELVATSVLGIDVALRVPAEADPTKLEQLTTGADRVRRVGDELSLTLPAETDVDAWLVRAHAAGAKLTSLTPRHETLEDLFLREVADADASPAAMEGRT